MAQKPSTAQCLPATVEYYAPEPVKQTPDKPEAPIPALEQMFGYYGTR